MYRNDVQLRVAWGGEVTLVMMSCLVCPFPQVTIPCINLFIISLGLFYLFKQYILSWKLDTAINCLDFVSNPCIASFAYLLRPLLPASSQFCWPINDSLEPLQIVSQILPLLAIWFTRKSLVFSRAFPCSCWAQTRLSHPVQSRPKGVTNFNFNNSCGQMLWSSAWACPSTEIEGVLPASLIRPFSFLIWLNFRQKFNFSVN